MGKLALALLAGTMACGQAQAATFDFTIDGALTGSGVLTATDNNNGSFTITGITGQADNQTITGLAPTGSYGGNDNALFPTAAAQLDFNGFTFLIGDIQYNVYFGTQNTGLPGYQYSNTGNAAYDVGFNATSTDSAVPEPATWGMMILGFGVAGYAVRRRAKVRTTVGIA